MMTVAAQLLPRQAQAAFAGDFRAEFEEATSFFRQKVSLPTKTWRSISGRAHDRAFVVAGATRDALLSDIRQAVDEAIAGGMRLKEFEARFEAIVARNGWTGWTGEGTAEGRAWRARVIYETNLRTAYAAGRRAQMTHPDMIKVRPYWQYRHGDVRRPRDPRPQHVAWNGLVLAWNDPWWGTHYPPNGWGCSCGVRPVSRRELAAMGKDAPDEAPPILTRRVRDPLTGDIHDVPEGIAFGWDHAPGKDWADGLVPPELQRPLGAPDSLPAEARGSPRRTDLPEMPPARASTAPDLPEDLAPESYADIVLQHFGAAPGENGARLWRDPAGHAVVISEALLKDGKGNWKTTKRERARSYLRAVEALTDPDEIWVDWERILTGPRRGEVEMRRRYIRRAAGNAVAAVFTWSRSGWQGATLFAADSDERRRLDYIEAQRHGALLWRRPLDWSSTEQKKTGGP